jgi:hypothetical protein
MNCGDVKCNEVTENLKGVKPNGRKVKLNRVKFIGNEVSISVVQRSKSLGKQYVLCTVITRMLLIILG